MVKIFGIAFTALLVGAHYADWRGDAYHRPLSMFRDYEPAWMGYAIFALLTAIGLETIRTACRVQAIGHAGVYFFATTMLAVVAATPSNNAWHIACAMAAIAGLFVYYAALLYLSDALLWLMLHLLTPSLLLMATRGDSYGIWQKWMIAYFTAAVVVHQHLLAQWLPPRNRKRSRKISVVAGSRRTAW